MEKICGIYEIKNTIDNKRYIGSSIDIYKRWSEHKSNLQKKQHHSIHLQHSWNKYTAIDFTFQIIEEVKDKSILLKREGFFVQKYKTLNQEFGYNIKKIDENGRIELSDETKKKLSEIMKGRHSGEDSLKAILTQKQVDEIRKKHLTGKYAAKTLAKEYKTSRGCIQQIIQNKTWKDPNYTFIPRKFSSKDFGSGENHSQVKLNWKKVREIRKKHLTGDFFKSDLAKEYGVSKGCIQAIIENHSWHDSSYTYISISCIGENCHNAKLTQEQANEIREKYIPCVYTFKMLAKEYKVSLSTIQTIIENRTWHDPMYKPIIKKNAKLTQKQADEIRKKYISLTHTIKMLAEEYKTSESTVQRIIKNKSYKTIQ